MTNPELLIVAMHAIVDRGDGTINLYRGPAGPETDKAIDAINEWYDGVAEPNPDDETIQDANGGIQDCESDVDLAETLLWWANSGAPRSEWEVDTGASTGIDLG
jgi:hypothetical protein